MITLQARLLTLSTLLSALALLVPLMTRAENVVWSAPQPDLVYAGGGHASAIIQDPMVSITYHAQAFESNASGAKVRPLASGETLPVGSWVFLEFPVHTYTDIYWFGTGSTYDSPYGDWLAGASPPPAADRCSPKNLYQANSVGSGGSKERRDLYAALSVSPPTKNILMGGQSASCQSVSGTSNLLCELTNPGVVSATFTFAPTTGKFYGGQISLSGGDAKYGCLQRDTPYTLWSGSGMSSTGAYTLQVPQQTVPLTLNVSAPAGEPPSTPTLASTAACVTGSPHSIDMTSTDSDGDNLRYGIDWDADGSIDEYKPPTGYVPSGTTLSASRTYAMTGSKTVKVLAQDEGGKTSSFASITFSCANPPPPPPEEEEEEEETCPVGYSLQNDVCVFTSCPSGYTLQGNQCVTITDLCPNITGQQSSLPSNAHLAGNLCLCDSGYTLQGGQCVPTNQCTAQYFCQGNSLYQTTAQCSTSFVEACTYGCAGGACIPEPAASGTLTANPALVGTGQTTFITWTTQNTKPNTCSVSENNPEVTDSWTGPSGTETSSPLVQQTIYTLACTGLNNQLFTKSVTVNIIYVESEE